MTKRSRIDKDESTVADPGKRRFLAIGAFWTLAVTAAEALPKRLMAAVELGLRPELERIGGATNGKYVPPKAQRFLPSYVPPNYRLMGVTIGPRPRAFGGNDDILMNYRKLSSGRDEMRKLMVGITRQTNAAFFGTEGRTATVFTAQAAGGSAYTAEYFDGTWGWQKPLSGSSLDGVHWNNSDAHSVVFRLPEFAVGVRGCRKGSLGVDELVRVALSVVG
jgi:hypothetical protein